MLLRLFILILFAVTAAGCTPVDGLSRGGELSGTVKLDGKPLGGGRVEITHADGRNMIACEIRPDGGYTLREPPLGDCKLAVVTNHLRATKPARSQPGMILPKEVGLVYTPLPAKYESAATAGLPVTVVKGMQKFDIELSAK